MYKFGFVNYFNSLPIHHGFECPDVQNVFGTPVEVSDQLLNGKLDAGLIPVFDYIKNKDSLSIFGDICIAAKCDVIKSVLFFSSKPIGEVSDLTINLTDHSRTSVQLLKIILNKYGNKNVSYRYAEQRVDQLINQEKDNMLLIGNEALKAKKILQNTGHKNYFCYDLAQEWFAITGLPFVFAVLVIHTNLLSNMKSKDVLITVIDKTLNENLKSLSILAENNQTEIINKTELYEYWDSISYKLNPENHKSIELFEEYINAENKCFI